MMETTVLQFSAHDHIYGFTTQVMSREGLIDGLSRWYVAVGSSEIGAPAEFEKHISGFDKVSLENLFFEVAVSNDRFDPASRTFFLDPGCTIGYPIYGLYSHLYSSQLRDLAEQIGETVTDESMREHIKAVTQCLVSGKGRATLSLGNCSITVVPATLSLVVAQREAIKALPDLDRRGALDALGTWKTISHEEAGKKNNYDEALSL